MLAVEVNESSHVTASYGAEQVAVGDAFPMVDDACLRQVGDVHTRLAYAQAVVGIFRPVENFLVKQAYSFYNFVANELASSYDIFRLEGNSCGYLGGTLFRYRKPQTSYRGHLL